MSAPGKHMFDDASSDGAGVGQPARQNSSGPLGASGQQDVNESSLTFTSSSSSADAAPAHHVDPAAEEGAQEQEVTPTSIGFIRTVQTPTPAQDPTPAAPSGAAPAPAAAPKDKPPTSAAASTPVSASKKRAAATGSAAAPTPNTARASLDTPATVSKRPEREELEYSQASPDRYDSARKPTHGSGTPAAAADKYREVNDGPVYSTHKTRSSRRNLDFQNNESNLNHYGDDADDDNGAGTLLLGVDMAAVTTVEDIVTPYLFPRMDPDLADWDEPEREHTLGKKKLAMLRHAPPNCVESNCAYLLATDRRLAVYFVLVFLAIVFTIVSIPTSQIDISSAELVEEVANNMVLTPDGVYNFSNMVNVKSCYTYWGFKEDCDSAPYTLPVSLMPCTAIKTRLQAGAAFSIISLVIYLVLFVMVTIVVCCLTESPRVREKDRKKNTKARWVIGSVGLVCVVTQLICWAAVAGIYTSYNCTASGTPEGGAPSSTQTLPVIHDENKAYGVGFGLSLTAWCLHLLAVVQLLALPGYVVNHS